MVVESEHSFDNEEGSLENIADPSCINTALEVNDTNNNNENIESERVRNFNKEFSRNGNNIVGQVSQSVLKNSDLPSTSTSLKNNDIVDTVIEITDTRKVGDGISSYINYVITTKTTSNRFQSRTMTVERRYSEFFAFRTRIVDMYVVQGYIIPSIPEKDVLSASKGKVNNVNERDDTFIEKRRVSLSIFLNACVRKEILKGEPLLIEFLENPTLPKYPGASSMSTAGFMRFINSLTNSKTIGGVVQIMDEPYVKKIEEAEEIEHSLRTVVNANHSMMTKLQEIQVFTDHYAQCLSNLANTECDKELGLICSKLACLEETLNSVKNKSMYSSLFNLHVVVSNVILNYDGIREVNHARVKSYKMWKDALLQRTKKIEMLHKAEMNGRADKIFAVKEEIREWQELEEKYNTRYNTISKRFLSELKYIEDIRIRDMKEALSIFVRHKYQAHLKASEYWKKFSVDFNLK